MQVVVAVWDRLVRLVSSQMFVQDGRATLCARQGSLLAMPSGGMVAGKGLITLGLVSTGGRQI